MNQNDKPDPCYPSPGQKAVVMASELWSKLCHYLHDKGNELPEDIKPILTILIIQTSEVHGD